MTELPPFPVDDLTLDHVLHALDTSYGETDENGDIELVGGEFTLNQLLNFLSGYDSSNQVLIDEWEGVPVMLYTGGQLYSPHCVIRALINEVRRLRKEGR